MEQKNLMLVAISLCLFSALGMLFGIWVGHHSRSALTIYTMLFFVPLVAALWLNHRLSRPFAGE